MTQRCPVILPPPPSPDEGLELPVRASSTLAAVLSWILVAGFTGGLIAMHIVLSW